MRIGRSRVPGVTLAAVAAFGGNVASAVQPFGFVFGMSPDNVQSAIAARGWGTTWVGKTLSANGPGASYLFNFCDNKLYEVNGTFAPSFDQMANIVDSSIKSYGQPWHVSADGGMTY